MALLRLEELRARLPPRPLTRFAPSPTGYLHLGHVVNAVFVWGVARALNGRVLLRLEDHDRGRCRPEYETAILDDLEWLGLEPDGDAVAELRRGPSSYRQSDCSAAYAEALDRLSRSTQVYGCSCSRNALAQEAGARPGREVPYPGRCRRRGLEPGPGRGTRIVLGDGEERFEDARLGPRVHRPAAQCGDLLGRDRLGNWTYQFAVTVDDLRHRIDLVIRGEDLLASTGRQIRLARLLGRDDPPVFLHHPLILKPSGEKLSKASRDTGIRDLRAAGWTQGQVLGEAAWRAGVVPEARPIGVADLPGLLLGHPDEVS